MSLRSYERRARRRWRLRLLGALTKSLIAVCLVGASIFYAYRVGLSVGDREAAALHKRIARLSQTISELQGEGAAMLASAEAARRRAAELQRRYDQDIPAGEIGRLLDLARAKLAAGIEPTRLALVIQSAGDPKSCEKLGTAKRFIVRTPLYRGANDVVSFAEGTITVFAEGESATDSAGNHEAWFDPARELTVHFATDAAAGGKVIGTLPLRHATVVNDWEYRFTVTAGQRGFVRVTALRCRYP